MSAYMIYLLCILMGGTCLFAPSAHGTVYAPDLGGINCAATCSVNACGYEPSPGDVACGPMFPCGTRMYTELWGWRTCHDRGGAIDNDEFDVYVSGEEYKSNPWSGYVEAVWVLEVPK